METITGRLSVTKNGNTPMRFTLTAFLLFTLVVMGVHSSLAYGQRYHIDHFYIAPPEPEPEPEATAKALHDKRYPLPEDTVRAWVNVAMPTRVVEAFNVNDTATKQLLQEAPPHQVAVHHRLNAEAASLFGEGRQEANRQVHLGSIRSHGAYALRLRVNLMGLRSGDALWVLDAEGAAAFGPYTTDRADAEDCWLPVTIGDAVVLALESKDSVLPLLTVLDVAHFYKPIVEKQQLTPLTCNIPIAQEANATAQEISAAVGRLLVPFTNGTGLCTTTLLNSEKRTAGAPTPYIISAWHCLATA